jgi:hypothetical protein
MGYNLFSPIDGFVNWLWSRIRRNPLRSLKILGVILLVFFVIDKCSGVSEKEKAAEQTPKSTQTEQVQQ